MTDFKKAKNKWINKNPLRKFRTENNLTQSDVANHIGTSLTTVQFWEQGTNIPDKDNMNKLSKLLNEPELERRWVSWYNTRPKIA